MDADVTKYLKINIIDQYKKAILQLQKGYKPSLDYIKDSITVVDLDINDLTTIQYYLNNGSIE